MNSTKNMNFKQYLIEDDLIKNMLKKGSGPLDKLLEVDYEGKIFQIPLKLLGGRVYPNLQVRVSGELNGEEESILTQLKWAPEKIKFYLKHNVENLKIKEEY